MSTEPTLQEFIDWCKTRLDNKPDQIVYDMIGREIHTYPANIFTYDENKALDLTSLFLSLQNKRYLTIQKGNGYIIKDTHTQAIVASFKGDFFKECQALCETMNDEWEEEVE